MDVESLFITIFFNIKGLHQIIFDIVSFLIYKVVMNGLIQQKREFVKLAVRVKFIFLSLKTIYKVFSDIRRIRSSGD